MTISPKLQFLILAIPVAGLALLTFILWSGGYRLNATPSLPKGVYQINGQARRALIKGDLACFCLESSDFLELSDFTALAKERGYLAPGSCASGLRPLLKQVAGLPGDVVGLTPEGLITVNNKILPATARALVDSQGRHMPPSLLNSGLIPDGRALMISAGHKGGFDSRYFGLVPITELQKVEPVFIF